VKEKKNICNYVCGGMIYVSDDFMHNDRSSEKWRKILVGVAVFARSIRDVNQCKMT
jgi:hypothetical protein